MKATIGLELFGENHKEWFRLMKAKANSGIPGAGDILLGRDLEESFVAEISGLDPRYGFARQFLRGSKDYSRSNSKGSRGVFKWYILESGRIYDVQRQVTWKRLERFYCTVDEAGDIIKLTKEEVDARLRRRAGGATSA